RDLNFKRPLIDLRQAIPLLHELTFLERHIDELPVNPTADGHRVRCSSRAETAQVYRHIRFVRGHRDHSHASSGPASTSAAPASTTGSIGRLNRSRIGRRNLPGLPPSITSITRTADNEEKHQPTGFSAPPLFC